MLKPSFTEEEIVKHLWNFYDLQVTKVKFRTLGADLDTAVYQVTVSSGIKYFFKLRRVFNECIFIIAS